MTMKGKVALVTGGSRGIGRAIAIELAKRGASVAINFAKNAEEAEKTAALCRELSGAEAIILKGDMSSPTDAESVVNSVTEHFGGLHILVNNAGITRDGLMLRLSENDWDSVMDTNLKSAFLTSKAAYKTMMRQKYGRIINITSVVALRGNPGQANYCASKAGLIGLTKSLAKELAGKNVTVNAIAPGFIETDMTSVLPESAISALKSTIPMKRGGKPEDIANAAAFFAEEASAYITGQVLCVDGGMAM